MNVSIKLDNCKCGEQIKLKRVREWHGVLCEVIYSYCPKRHWHNFWKHQKPQEHAYMPYPSVNKWKIKKPTPVEEAKKRYEA